MQKAPDLFTDQGLRLFGGLGRNRTIDTRIFKTAIANFMRLGKPKNCNRFFGLPHWLGGGAEPAYRTVPNAGRTCCSERPGSERRGRSQFAYQAVNGCNAPTAVGRHCISAGCYAAVAVGRVDY